MDPSAILHLVSVALLAIGSCLPQPSLAESLVVDSTVDVGDPTPDGPCLEIVGGSPPSFEFGCPLRIPIFVDGLASGDPTAWSYVS